MDFYVLKDLARSVSRNKAKQIDVLGNLGPRKSRTQKLYEAILSDKFDSEKELVRYLFNTHDPKHPSYLKLKKRLINQLLNTSLFLDYSQPFYNERAKAYFTAYKDYASAFVICLRISIRASLHIFQNILEQAIKYEFIDLAAEVSKMLRREYLRAEYDNEKSKHFTLIHRKYEKKRYYENLALDYYEDIVAHYARGRSVNINLYKEADRCYNELFPMLEEVNTSAFYYYTYNICLIKHFSQNEIFEALKTANQALNVLKERKNTNRSMLCNVTIQQMACYTHLKVEENTFKSSFDFFLSLVEVNDFSWFRGQEVYFYYSTYRKKYTTSTSICKIVFKNEKFSNLHGYYHENWLLLAGYLHLLSKLDLLESELVLEAVGPFRYNKLANEVEVINKEKEGMNIPLLFLPVLYELAQNPKDRTKEIPIEALDKYRQRWLANDMNRRSNSFLKILLTLAQSTGSSTVNEKKIRKEWEILKNETPEVAGQSFAIEIVPYEDLVELLLTKMGLTSLVRELFPR